VIGNSWQVKPVLSEFRREDRARQVRVKKKVTSPLPKASVHVQGL